MSDVHGKVTDFFTGRPIAGATVMFGSRIVTTDGNGDFTLTDLPPTFYEILVVHKDYERTPFQADLTVNQPYVFEPFRIKPIFRALHG